MSDDVTNMADLELCQVAETSYRARARARTNADWKAAHDLTVAAHNEMSRRGLVGVCEYGHGRVGSGEPCTCTQAQRYDAGAYGSLVLCQQHAAIAMRLHNESVEAMEESGRALAQMLSDERAMMRG